ncbi:hypothetical protein BDN72DRAFT_903500 [Pluteus cervinus]|uniref:Uncharacterized protein n=1 Tax=Pluteus cervinus TaxID=181527 RepID=A0ACD3A9Q5_9AGAR|nr:hypothetical protein BDN72DRAFT_903500 [Pluteus cervinus]
MLLVDLPRDILEGIAQSLTTIDKKSLPSLALASRALCHPTQRQIFQSIFLTVRFHNSAIPYSSNPLSPPPHLTRLRNVLTENPMLATYVQEVQCTYLEISPSIGLRNWMVDHGLLFAEILELLGDSPIKYLSILSTPCPSSILTNWTSFHNTLQQTLIHRIFNKGTLSSVHIGGFSLPQNVFRAFVRLTDVCLGDVLWLPRDDDLFHSEEPSSYSNKQIQSTGNSPLQRLSSLRVTISDTRNASLEILGPEMGFELTRLQTLQLDLVIAVPRSSIDRFLLLPNLKDLTISFPPRSPAFNTNTPPTGIDLNAALKLRNLTLLHNLFFLDLDDFSWIGPTLSSLQPTVALRTLTITIILCSHISDYSHTSDTTEFTVAFTTLSQTLSCFHRVFESKLERIGVEIELIYPERKESVELFKRQIEEHLVWDGCGDVLMLTVAAVEGFTMRVDADASPQF